MNRDKPTPIPAFTYSLFVYTISAGNYELLYNDIDAARAVMKNIADLQMVTSRDAKKHVDMMRVSHTIVIDDSGAEHQFVVNNIGHMSLVNWRTFHEVRHAHGVRLRKLCEDVERQIDDTQPVGFASRKPEVFT